MTGDAGLLQKFVTFSAALTGFREFDLWGTGQAAAYLAAVRDRAGEKALRELLEAGSPDGDGSAPPGPVARSIIKLWYVGIWYPPENADEAPFTVSPTAYTEGLLWRAIGAHPAGAKGPGYGSWAEPPAFEGASPATAEVTPGNPAE